jgi:hypothetical protein
MVARGLDRWVELKAEENLNSTFGVTLGNNSEMEELSPAQRITYMVGAAEQHPFAMPEVRDTISHDIVWYYILGLISIVLIYIGGLIQETNPELVSSMYEKVTGHDGFLSSNVTINQTLKVAFLPLAALMLIDTAMSIEQLASSGLMQDAMQYIQLSTKTIGVFLFESLAYASCGSLFATRIIYINFFCKHIIKILIIFILPWYSSSQFAKMLWLWFLTSLFSRPIVLWYSSLAVEDIASKTTTTDMIAATQFNMTLVIIISFITMLVFVLWPVINFILKIIVNYIMGAGYKLIKLNNSIKILRRL